MATAHNNTFSGASRGTILIGPLPWVASMVPDQFFTIPGGVPLKTWTLANLPQDNYGGTNPMGAMLDAFCDPAIDYDTGKQYIYGGGHGDGKCNAVIEFDPIAMTYRTVFSPTPVAKMPPKYLGVGVTIPANIYPSGTSGQGGIFDGSSTPKVYSMGHFRSDLTDPADTMYNTPRGRACSHMYGAACLRGHTIHYFYGTYAEFDILTGTWADLGHYPDAYCLYTSFMTFQPNYGDVELQEGTMSIYDSVTDRFFITLTAGSAGGGWRTSIMVFNPVTRAFTNIFDQLDSDYGFIGQGVNLILIGRNLWGFTRGSSYPNGNMNQGFIMNMDTLVRSKFVLVGDVEGSLFSADGAQESIPSFYDGVAIRRWNYSATYKGFIYSVSITPESGTGTIADPYVMRQTKRALSGAIPDGKYIYKRFVYNAALGCAVLLPSSTQPPVALKLS